MQTYLQKRGARNLVRLGETIVRSSGAVAFCTPYTVCVLPELCGPEFEHYSSVPLCSRPPFIKTTQYSWTSLCETHSAHALGHGAAHDISWTGHADPIGSPDHSVCTPDQEHCCRGLTILPGLDGLYRTTMEYVHNPISTVFNHHNNYTSIDVMHRWNTGKVNANVTDGGGGFQAVIKNPELPRSFRSAPRSFQLSFPLHSTGRTGSSRSAPRPRMGRTTGL